MGSVIINIHILTILIMKTMLASSLLLVTLVSRVSSEQCQHPPPSPHFNNSLYSGRWYEVGKYQTLGGSIFQQDTVCTIATYDPYDLVSGGGILATPVANTRHQETGSTPLEH